MISPRKYNLIHVVGNMSPNHGGAQKVIDMLRSDGESNGRFSHHVFAALQKEDGFEDVYNAGIPKALMPFALPGRLERYLKEKRADLVHIHSAVVGPWIRRVARRCNLPSVTTLHSPPSKYKRWVWEFERRSLKRDRKIACVSGAVKEDLARYEAGLASAKAMVIHNGVDMASFAEVANRRANRVGQLGNKPARILLFGRLNVAKGVDVALRAVATLITGDRDVLLDVVGEGPELPALEALARELGIEGRVIFHGSTNDVTEYLETCDLCVLPSRWEGFGLTFIEAIGSGVPVVASEIAAFREIFPTCQHFVPSEDNDALAKELIRVLDALPEEKAKALDEAPRVRERFDVGQMVCSYAQLYQQVLNAC